MWHANFATHYKQHKAQVYVATDGAPSQYLHTSWCNQKNVTSDDLALKQFWVVLCNLAKAHLFQHSGCERLGGVMWVHWYNSLRQNGPCIILLIYKVHCGARPPYSGSYHCLMHPGAVQAFPAKCWQQAWMNVQHGILILSHQGCRNQLQSIKGITTVHHLC